MTWTSHSPPEQTDYVARAAAFETDLVDNARVRESTGRIEPDLVAAMGAQGLIAPELPEELGGRGQTKVLSGLVTEAIGRGDLTVAYLQVVGSLTSQVIARNARPHVAREFCGRITSGSGRVAIGISEPGTGSDAGNPTMTAYRDGPDRDGTARHGDRAGTDTGGDGPDWILTGTKSMSFALCADATIVFARTDEKAGRGRGITAFLVDLDAPGVTTHPVTDHGQASVERGIVDFVSVRVPDERRLGDPGQAFTQVMQGFDFSRALIGLQCVGSAQRTVEDTWAYVKDRQAFDQPLSTFQGVAFPLAEAQTKMHAARLMCLEALWRGDEGLPHTTQAAMCKWWAPLEATNVIQQCLLLHGQNGYKAAWPIEKRLRDCLGMQIGDGTAQIMKLVIARQTVGREFAP